MVVQLQTVSKAGEVVYASAYRAEQQLAQGTWTAFDPSAFKGKEKEEVRIISQNGMADYPYDNIMVWVDRLNPKGIGATMCSDPDSEFPLGTYNSEEDAKFVIEMIGTSYMIGSHWMHMPDCEQAMTLRESYLANRKDEECYYRYLKRMGAHAV